MLKPIESEPPPERPVGELVQELVEEGKAYAKAEIDLAKAIAIAKARALAVPSALFGVAFLLGLAGVTGLAIGVFGALSWPLGPILAGFVTFLIFAALAAGLAWYAVLRLKRDL